MLITFKSSADGDVIMFGEVGQSMLKVLGKDGKDARGIVTLEQLPQAIQALQSAIDADRAEQAGAQPDDPFADQDRAVARLEPAVSFAQRAIPLLTMLQHSLHARVVVTWESV